MVTAYIMLYVCVGDDCHGADARWRLEGESDQNETNVRSQLLYLCIVHVYMVHESLL